MNRVAAFALRRRNSILSMSEKMFCPPQPLRFWITPACAGKRRSDWIIRSIYWDHPRVCGEKFNLKEMSKTLLGSPPRMRGKVVGSEELPGVVGITPACAEKRTAEPQKPDANWDHPRVCGEKLGVGAARIGCGGITPACAGKRSQGFAVRLSTRDHPRVCGEKSLNRYTPAYRSGLPPRVRGKVSAGKILLHDGGITPACAGKSLARSCLPGCLRDHPRVCGEKLFQSPLLRLPLGSPPRVRGKVSHVQVLQFWAGITPAHAGKSSGRW